MGYTFLSERQFSLAGTGACAEGFVSAGSAAPCICEDQGKLITIFPVLKSVEDELAGKNIAAVFTAMSEDTTGNSPKRSAFAGSGVFAVFPQKIKTRPAESPDIAWNRFFEELSSCENIVETVSPGKLLKSLNGLQKLCFPDSTGADNGMPPRRFIIQNPEAGGIYAKMIFTNVLINQLRGDKSRKLSAHEELWKAQGSTLFCCESRHALYNNKLRNAAYSALLGAERVTREKGKFVPSLVSFDFNMDGAGEWLFQDTKINCYVQSLGGGIFELDYLPKAWNYLDSCRGRTAFADRLLPPAVTAEKLVCGSIAGERMCCNEHYEPTGMDKVRRKLRLVLSPQEPSPQKHAMPFGCIAIAKTYHLKKDTVTVGYTLENRGAENAVFGFSPGLDLALPGEGDTFARFFTCKAGNQDTVLTEPAAPSEPLLNAADGIKIHDLKNEVQIYFTSSLPFTGCIMPVYMPEPSAAGGTGLYQAYCVMPLLPVSLKPEDSWEVEFTLKFSH
jgi:hypothetical protein